MFVLLDLLLPLLHLGKLLLQALLLFLAALLQLDFCLGKARFFFDERLNDDDFVLFNCSSSDLLVECFCLCIDLSDLVRVLRSLVFKLFYLTAKGYNSRRQLSTPLLLLLDSGLKLGNLLLIVVLLVL